MTLPAYLQRILPSQINPVAIKELRQSVRSRFVAGILLLFLAVELFGVAITILSSAKYDNSLNYYTGRNTFHFLYIALSTACIIFIPIYAAIRLAMERWDNNMDLMYITTIKPHSIIRGKLFASTAVSLLLFSAAAPFMSFSYLLRGIDLPSIFIAMVFVFIFVMALTQIMIFAACLPTGKAFKIVLALAAVIGLFWSLILVNIAGWQIIYQGYGSKIKDAEFWITAASVLIGVSLGIGLLQRMSVALISSPSTNRSLPVRRYAVFVWAVTGAGTIAIAAHQYNAEIIQAWMVPAVICLCLSVIWGLGESTNLSMRVRRAIPHNPIMRRLAFLFYNGPAAALCWAFWMTLLTFAVSFTAIAFIDNSFNSDILETSEAMTSLFCYSIAYGLTAVFLWRKFLSERLRPASISIITCILIVVGALLPVIISMMLQVGTRDWEPAWYMGNIFTVAKDNHRETHMAFSMIFAITATAVNARWIMNQMRNFTRQEAEAGVGGQQSVVRESSATDGAKTTNKQKKKMILS